MYVKAVKWTLRPAHSMWEYICMDVSMFKLCAHQGGGIKIMDQYMYAYIYACMYPFACRKGACYPNHGLLYVCTYTSICVCMQEACINTVHEHIVLNSFVHKRIAHSSCTRGKNCLRHASVCIQYCMQCCMHGWWKHYAWNHAYVHSCSRHACTVYMCMYVWERLQHKIARILIYALVCFFLSILLSPLSVLLYLNLFTPVLFLRSLWSHFSSFVSLHLLCFLIKSQYIYAAGMRHLQSCAMACMYRYVCMYACVEKNYAARCLRHPTEWILIMRCSRNASASFLISYAVSHGCSVVQHLFLPVVAMALQHFDKKTLLEMPGTGRLRPRHKTSTVVISSD